MPGTVLAEPLSTVALKKKDSYPNLKDLRQNLPSDAVGVGITFEGKGTGGKDLVFKAYSITVIYNIKDISLLINMLTLF